MVSNNDVVGGRAEIDGCEVGARYIVSNYGVVWTSNGDGAPSIIAVRYVVSRYDVSFAMPINAGTVIQGVICYDRVV